ncbi:MAG: glycosyltransferase family 39 protein [Candidatus Omnitrophica bacterium]|nr:glycosyltransferase family 39 protein [Candidatus Omnitrophota bacterium]MCB9748068.1 glycosyltransferase family 39 protein [Candidatus Omnitrophota bacterium]
MRRKISRQEGSLSNKFFFPGVISLVFFYYSFYFWAEFFIKYFFDQGRFDLLNVWSGALQNYPLDYYLGQIENRFFGPGKMILSGGAFMAIAWRYLKTRSLWMYMLAVFLYFLVTRPEVLMYPPFGESVTAPYAEAVWLVRNSLNYFELQQQLPKTLGGMLYYPFSIYSFLAAVFLKFLPGAIVFNLTMHVITFLMSASIVAVLREILRQYFNDEIALLGSFLLLSLPIYQCMTEMINMEMSLVFFAVFSFYYLIKNRMIQAFVFAVLSMLIKLPGAIACGAVFIYSFFLAAQKNIKSERIKIVFLGVLAVLLTGGKLVLRLIFRQGQTKQNTINFLNGLSNIIIMPEFWMFCAISIIFFLQFIVKLLRKENLSKEVLRKHTVLWLSWFMSLVWFGLYANFSVMGPRYKLLLYPFLIIVLTVCLHRLFLIKKNVLKVIFSVMILWNLIGSFGWPTTDYVASGVYGFNSLERSLEYRNMLKLQIKLSALIEEKYSDFIIGAPHVIAQALHFKELGYVSKEMEVVVYGMNPTHGLRPVPPMTTYTLLNMRWIAFDTSSNPRIPFPYPMDPKDVVLDHLWVGDRHIYIFQGGFAIEKMREIISRMD